MLAESGLYNSLRAHAVSTTGQPMCIYGDPAYPLRIHLQAPFRQRVLTPQQQAYNGSMGAVRCPVEWLFSDIVNYFKFLDFKKESEDWTQPSRENVHCLCSPSKCFDMFVW